MAIVARLKPLITLKAADLVLMQEDGLALGDGPKRQVLRRLYYSFTILYDLG